MNTLLYIGHDYHNKTKSTQFLQDIFKTKYQVTTFNFDPYNDTEEKFRALDGQFYDVVVLFQIMPAMKIVSSKLKYENIVFFPMYDGVPGLDAPIWNEYRHVTIINFSKMLHHNLVKAGFHSFYIQYFPAPIGVSNWGDEKSVFFWQRTSDITVKTIERLLDVESIKHLHLHQAIDPAHEILYPSESWGNKVSYSSWYDKREDMQKDIEKSSIYIAPRRYEGIGMSFLEAMAMGRCVIAPNNPTMNEYIEHGKNGLLYDLNNPTQITVENIKTIQKQTFSYIKQGYETWERDKYKILEWLETKPKADMKKKIKCMLSRLKSFCFTIRKSPNVVRIRILGVQVIKIVKECR